MSKGILELLNNNKHSISNAAKIVNGEFADEGEYPYAVSLQQAGSHFCGGTLITPSVVLSASHCFEDTAGFQPGDIIQPVSAVLGCNNVLNVNGDCEIINVISATLHPQYDLFQSVLGGNDLAILVLEEPSSQPLAQIPSPLVGQDAFTDFPSFEVGWGNEVPVVQTFVGGDDLMEADSLVLDNNVCGNQNDILFELAFGVTDTIDDTMICSTAVSKGVCQGDSGGPLLMICDGVDQDLVIGATSFGLGCAMTGHPSVFARTFNQAGFDFIVDRVTAVGELGSLNIVEDFSAFCPDAPLELDPNVVPTPFPTINANLWTCPGEFYGTQDGCDCNCGIPDPDCQFDDDAIGCLVIEFCNDDAKCQLRDPGLIIGLPIFGCCCCIFLVCCLPLICFYFFVKKTSGADDKNQYYNPPPAVYAK